MFGGMKWCVLALALLCSQNALADPGYRLLEIDGHDVKWGEQKLGSGTVVTYAIARGPAQYSGGRSCARVTGVDSLLAADGIAAEALDTELSAALAMWENAANIRFQRVGDPATADILIAAQTEPRGLSYADFASLALDAPVGRIEKGIVCLNPTTAWRLSGAKARSGKGNVTFELRYALAHEIGHLLGLDHPVQSGELMSAFYDEQFRALQPGDIAGAAVLYGPPAFGGERYRTAGNIVVETSSRQN